MKVADLWGAMEWTVTIEGPDQYGEIQRLNRPGFAGGPDS